MARTAVVALSLALAAIVTAACAGPSGAATSPAPSQTVAPSTAAAAGPGCQGADTADWSAYPAIVRQWGEAWMAPDDATRAEILEEVWAEDGFYADPFVEAPVIGRDALAAHMAYGMGPGQYVEVSAWTPEDRHHDRLRIRWRHCCPTGVSLVQGTDVGEIDAEGRLKRVTSFWNNEVALPADVACG